MCCRRGVAICGRGAPSCCRAPVRAGRRGIVTGCGAPACSTCAGRRRRAGGAGRGAPASHSAAVGAGWRWGGAAAGWPPAPLRAVAGWGCAPRLLAGAPAQAGVLPRRALGRAVARRGAVCAPTPVGLPVRPVGGRAATRGSAAVGWSVGGRDVGDGGLGVGLGARPTEEPEGRHRDHPSAGAADRTRGGAPRVVVETSDPAATRSRVDAVDATSAAPSRGPDRPNGLQVRTRSRRLLADARQPRSRRAVRWVRGPLTRRAAAARCAPARWPRSAPGSGRTCRAAP